MKKTNKSKYTGNEKKTDRPPWNTSTVVSKEKNDGSSNQSDKAKTLQLLSGKPPSISYDELMSVKDVMGVIVD